MEIKLIKIGAGGGETGKPGGLVAEVVADGIVLAGLDDALDILGQCYYAGADAMIMNAENITPEFFDLSTRIAGEILQKFSTYGMKFAIVGDFSGGSGSLRDFIRESNGIGHTFFVATTAEALRRLGVSNEE